MTFNVNSKLFVLMSHTLTVWSWDADAIFLPSGENAQELTPSLWRIFRSNFPVSASHTLTIPLLDAEAILLPSGEKTQERTLAL